MSTYAIRFDFPESDLPLFAGVHKGALGWAPSITTALLFQNAEEAQNNLENGYGAAKRYGRVVAVRAGSAGEVVRA